MVLLAKRSPRFRTLGTHDRSVAPRRPPSPPYGNASQAPSRRLQRPPPIRSPLIVRTLAATRSTNSGGRPLTGATALGSPLNGSPTTCGLTRRQFSLKGSRIQDPVLQLEGQFMRQMIFHFRLLQQIQGLPDVRAAVNPNSVKKNQRERPIRKQIHRSGGRPRFQVPSQLEVTKPVVRVRRSRHSG